LGALASRVTGRRYRLLAALAKGGMGEVFVGEEVGPKAQARSPLLAIKTLLPDVALDASMLNRFLDEARLSARLDHPNIARLTDFGEAAGRPFAVFELLDGADLAQCLDQLIDRRAQVPVEVALAVIIEAAQGLHHAHTLQKDGQPLEVVHRDLSPSNLFLTRAGEVKVLDFGAAWGRDRITKTKTGLIIGKLEYMAPEQVKGETLSARTDVFALGLCLWELLTTRRPYASNDEREQVNNIFFARVPDLTGLRPGLPVALYDAVKRMVAPDPLQRFGSASELAKALEPLLLAVTKDPRGELLTRFYGNCFGIGRHERREARLSELRAQPLADGTSFEWDAPSLNDFAERVELNSENIEIVGTPQPLRGPEPDTDKDPDPLGIRAKPRGNENPTTPTPAVKTPPRAPAPVTKARGPLTPYLVVGGIVFAALVIGLAIGRLAALGH